MSRYFEIIIEVHNVTIITNGMSVMVQNAKFKLPRANISGSDIVEACRISNQFLHGTSMYDIMDKEDKNEFMSCGKLGIELAALMYGDKRKRVTYESKHYNYYNTGLSWFKAQFRICNMK